MTRIKSKNRRNRGLFILGGIVVVVIIAIGATFPLWSPYFTNEEVDEVFPVLSNEAEAIATDENSELVAVSADNTAVPTETATAPTTDNQASGDSMTEDETAEPVALFSGSFNELDAVHKGEGTATIFELPDGERVLRFEDFRVTNGPDLYAVLSKNAPGGILDPLAEGYINLGRLKGNVGNQNYFIPDDVDLTEFPHVIIYCEEFRVTFSVASLS